MIHPYRFKKHTEHQIDKIRKENPHSKSYIVNALNTHTTKCIQSWKREKKSASYIQRKTLQNNSWFLNGKFEIQKSMNQCIPSPKRPVQPAEIDNLAKLFENWRRKKNFLQKKMPKKIYIYIIYIYIQQTKQRKWSNTLGWKEEWA